MALFCLLNAIIIQVNPGGGGFFKILMLKKGVCSNCNIQLDGSILDLHSKLKNNKIWNPRNF